MFVYIMHVLFQYHSGRLKWDGFGHDDVPFPTPADQKYIYGDWCAASVKQFKDGQLSREDLAKTAQRVWALQFLVHGAQQGFFTMNGKLVFQVGLEKHHWPPGGVSSASKVAMSILSFGQKNFNQPSAALLRFVRANWRAVVDYAFHPATSSRGMMRLTNPHDIPAPYATQPPCTLQSPSHAPPRTPALFVARSSTKPCMFCPPCAQAVRTSDADDGQPKIVRW